MVAETAREIRPTRAWNVLECNPRFNAQGRATGREIYLEPVDEWGDAGKDRWLIEAAPHMYEALAKIAAFGVGEWPGYTPHAVAYELAGVARAALRAAEGGE